jgi:hypothetical protein
MTYDYDKLWKLRHNFDILIAEHSKILHRFQREANLQKLQM